MTLLALAIGVSTFAYGTGSDLVVGAVLTVLAVPPMLRFPFLRVTLAPEGVVNHAFFRKQTIAWSNIDRVSITDTDGFIFSAKAPTLSLLDGEEVVLTNLAGYSTTARLKESRMARQAEAIRRGLASAPLA
ncbi:PH domain-containing protein [Cellulomonas sp. Root137]|uniref:PH domain-containing protein n=1 Tax=Cellulomonas sp. Root137 TaxID=1736459 RepID=UPI00138F871D|nr:PH domain-containing protein [Cellulomonas sp. Root137]